jgi:hypothetical protein
MVGLLKEAAAIALQNQDFSSAEKALAVLADKAPDSEVFMLSGRVAVTMSAANEFRDTQKAVDFFTKAVETKEGRNPDNPELDLVVLELAEALFFDGQYVQSAARANSFLKAQRAATDDPPALKSDNKATLYRYEPVAALLALSSEYMARKSSIERALLQMDRRLRKAPKKTELIVAVTGAGG